MTALQVWLLIVKKENSNDLIAAQVFSSSEIARKHSDKWLEIYHDVTAEVRPQIVCKK